MLLQSPRLSKSHGLQSMLKYRWGTQSKYCQCIGEATEMALDDTSI